MSGQPSGGIERYAPRHSMPATMSNIHEPPIAKNGRRISGLGYIRGSRTDRQKRSISHYSKSNEANYAPGMDWSSPELHSDPFWSHRYPGAGPLYGFTPVDTIKANSSLRVPALHRDANVYALPRCDRYESYAHGHSMSPSSPPSTNSPMLSESVATTTSSTETSQANHFHSMHDPFDMSPLLQSIPTTSPSLTKSPTTQRRSQRLRTYGITDDIIRRSHSRSFQAMNTLHPLCTEG